MICVTRVHSSSSSSLVDIQRVIDFSLRNTQLADRVMICLGIGDRLEHVSYYEELLRRLESEGLTSVSVIPISPWGGFTHSLNVAIKKALDDGFEKICFQSLEVKMNIQNRDLLLSFFDEKTLVVGPVLDGHDFNEVEGTVPLRGRTSPWNTYAIWNLQKLALVGFPLIGDGIGKAVPGGVEEVSAIAFAQFLDPNLEAKLIRLPVSEGPVAGSERVEWTTVFQDDERRRYHEQKMISKDTRPATQLAALGSALPEGRVQHISAVL